MVCAHFCTNAQAMAAGDARRLGYPARQSRLWLPRSGSVPSRLHEDLLRLFQNRPALAAEVARWALHAELPEFAEARIDSATLNDLRPAEYRADCVVVLLREQPVLGIIVEAQLGRDEEKAFTWPAYVCNLRSRIRCPVCLLVLTADDGVARWAARTIDLGGGNRFAPWVLSLSDIPEISDDAQAKADPELAVLSAVAHGGDEDFEKSARIARSATAALLDLDADRSLMYHDMVLASLSEAAREVLQAMIPDKYEFKSDFAKHYFGLGQAQGLSQGEAQGRAEGQAEGLVQGRAELVLRLLARRFGEVPQAVQTSLRHADIEALDRIGERLLTARSLADALDPR